MRSNGALTAARELTGDQGRVFVVFGCGGDRDRGKRPEMGRVAGAGADLVVVTSDNPRSEDPASIAAMVVEGLVSTDARSVVELDRRAAIRLAIARGRDGRRGADRRQGSRVGTDHGCDHGSVRRQRRRARGAGVVGMDVTLAEIAAITDGALHGGPADQTVTSFAFDSRVLEPGACFVALPMRATGTTSSPMPSSEARSVRSSSGCRPTPRRERGSSSATPSPRSPTSGAGPAPASPGRPSSGSPARPARRRRRT